MKRLGFGIGAVALAAASACASSDEARDGAPVLDEGDGGVALPDSAPATDGGDRADALPPKEFARCSDDNWCITDLPDEDLDLRDIRPFEARAFAVAESPSLGIQFLEWEKTTDAWKYIGDGTQNLFDRGTYAGNMWAASENEVYFTLAPAFVYHGIRPDPSAPFTWKVSRLDDPGAPAPAHDPGRVWAPNPAADNFAPSLGVDAMPWGDVYAWRGPTLFRRTVAPNGDDQWVVEHTLSDAETPEDEFHIQSIAGGSPDDLWMAGVRSRIAEDGVRECACPLAVQRRADGYHHFLDHVVDPTGDPSHLMSNVCDAKPGAMRLMSRLEFPEFNFVIENVYAHAGWMRGLRHIAPNTVVGLYGTGGLFYLRSDGETPLARINGFDAIHAPIPTQVPLYHGLWISGDRAWVAGIGPLLTVDYDPANWSRGVGIYPSGGAAVDVLQASAFSYSSIARSGVPHIEPLHQVRGLSNSNLWVIGNRHALHKTTP